MHIKLIFIKRFCTRTRFKTALGMRKLLKLMDYLVLLKMIKNTCCILVMVALKVLTGNLEKDNE